MMRVKIEIVPYGEENKAYEIERLDIFNKGYVAKTGSVCEYGVIHISDRNKAGMYTATLHHARSDGALVLLEKVLSKLVNNNHGDNHVRTPDDVGLPPTPKHE